MTYDPSDWARGFMCSLEDQGWSVDGRLEEAIREEVESLVENLADPEMVKRIAELEKERDDALAEAERLRKLLLAHGVALRTLLPIIERGQICELVPALQECLAAIFKPAPSTPNPDTEKAR